MKRTFRTGVSTPAVIMGAAATILSVPGSAGAATAAAAAAAETDYASRVSDTAAQCAYQLVYPDNGPGWVCFQKYGDILYVARSYWETSRTSVQWVNQLKNSSGAWVNYRSGECINDLGARTWGTCNKDFYENRSHNALGGYGSRIAYKACSFNRCTALSPWIYNDS
ncbi:hypothetical protein [Embleya sp. NPDC001921]